MISNHEVYLAGISSHEMELECLRRAITRQQEAIRKNAITQLLMQDRLTRQEAEFSRQVKLMEERRAA